MFYDFLNESGGAWNVGLVEHLALFGNEFDKFSSTRARMFYSSYHMTIEMLKYRIETSRFPHIDATI